MGPTDTMRLRIRDSRKDTPHSAECELQPQHRKATGRARRGGAPPGKQPTLLRKGVVEKPRERLGADSRLEVTREAT